MRALVRRAPVREGAGNVEVEVFWPLKELFSGCRDERGTGRTIKDVTTAMMPPTPILARLPESISKSPAK